MQLFSFKSFHAKVCFLFLFFFMEYFYFLLPRQCRTYQNFLDCKNLQLINHFDSIDQSYHSINCYFNLNCIVLMMMQHFDFSFDALMMTNYFIFIYFLKFVERSFSRYLTLANFKGGLKLLKNYLPKSFINSTKFLGDLIFHLLIPRPLLHSLFIKFHLHVSYFIQIHFEYWERF